MGLFRLCFHAFFFFIATACLICFAYLYFFPQMQMVFSSGEMIPIRSEKELLRNKNKWVDIEIELGYDAQSGVTTPLNTNYYFGVLRLKGEKNYVYFSSSEGEPYQVLENKGIIHPWDLKENEISGYFHLTGYISDIPEVIKSFFENYLEERYQYNNTVHPIFDNKDNSIQDMLFLVTTVEEEKDRLAFFFLVEILLLVFSVIFSITSWKALSSVLKYLNQSERKKDF